MLAVKNNKILITKFYIANLVSLDILFLLNNNKDNKNNFCLQIRFLSLS